MCWELMLDDVLPLELAIDQLPKRLDVGGVPLGVTYQPLLQNGVLSNVLIVMRDLTADLERERLDAEQRELSAALSRLSQDRESFRSFFEEASRIVNSLVSGQAESMACLARELHTLKGASSLFGLTSVAALCHSFEDRVLKLGHVHIGRGATVGENSVVFYGADVGEGVWVAPNSVVMKNEVLPAGLSVAGCPVEPVERT